MSCCDKEKEVIGQGVTSTKTYYLFGIPVFIVEYSQDTVNIYSRLEDEESES